MSKIPMYDVHVRSVFTQERKTITVDADGFSNAAWAAAQKLTELGHYILAYDLIEIIRVS